MRIGAVFPQIEIDADPGAVRAWATGVAELGFVHALAYDHVLGAGLSSRPDWAGPYNADTPFHEIFVLFGYLAAAAPSLELVTGVLILPQRQTVLVAKQAATVDVLTDGKFRLGIGIGWNKVEYDALNQTFADRARRSEEQVELLRTLWTDTAVSYSGRWHVVEDAGVNPLPVRRNIPVWFGGNVDATLRRIATLGDGWLPQRPPNEKAAEQVELLRGYVAEAGRSWEDIGIEARLSTSLVKEEGWAEYVRNWADLGATHLCVNTMGRGHSTVDAHLGELAQVLEALA